MKHLLSIVLLASTLLPLSCSPPYAPDTREIYNSREPSDIDQVALAKKAWDILGNPSRKKEWPGALNQYNHAVFTLLERGRKLNEHSGDRIQAPSGAFAVETSALGNDRDYRTYEDVIPCSKIQTSFHLEERVTVEGLGIPLAGIVKRNKNAVKRQNESLKDSGNIHTLTAILDFDHPVNGKPAMRFIPRLLEDSVNVGSTQQALAADFSAPISLFWDREDISNAGILGAFRPKKAVNYMGLYFSEPYSPKKYPSSSPTDSCPPRLHSPTSPIASWPIPLSATTTNSGSSATHPAFPGPNPHKPSATPFNTFLTNTVLLIVTAPSTKCS